MFVDTCGGLVAFGHLLSLTGVFIIFGTYQKKHCLVFAGTSLTGVSLFAVG
jgi:hypothetical protein